MQTHLHPSEATADQRRAAMADFQDAMARAMERAGGISAKRDAPVAREAAARQRFAALPTN